MADVRVALFANGREAFLDLLREHNIQFVEEPIKLGVVRVSGDIIGLVEVSITALTTVVVTWLRARAKRKIIVQAGTESFHMEGFSADQAKEILEAAAAKKNPITVIAIQTEKDEPHGR